MTGSHPVGEQQAGEGSGREGEMDGSKEMHGLWTDRKSWLMAQGPEWARQKDLKQ